MKGAGLGVLSVAAADVLAGCSGVSNNTTATGSATKTTSFTMTSNLSDAVPKAALAAQIAAFKSANPSYQVTLNTVSHNDFQNQINTYLQGSPDDIFLWFAGYRMQYYAAKGLFGQADAVWESIGGQLSDSVKTACTGADGHQYLVPRDYYPWAIFYRKSLWAQKGYTVPKSWDEFIALCKKMKGDGLVPIEFADKDGWPAMGTFDYVNLRTNGYQFHVDLLAHKESWDQTKVQKTFDHWKEMLPYQNPNALGMTWQDGANNWAKKNSGMYLLGTFLAQNFTDKAVLDDMGMFAFPAIEVEGQEAVEAPLDGAAFSPKGAKNSAAMDFMKYQGTAAGQDVYFKGDSSVLPVAKDASQASFTELNKASVELINNSKHVTQFFDRDALPAMASNVMIPALQTFIKSGTVDLKQIEAQAKTLYAS